MTEWVNDEWVNVLEPTLSSPSRQVLQASCLASRVPSALLVMWRAFITAFTTHPGFSTGLVKGSTTSTSIASNYLVVVAAATAAAATAAASLPQKSLSLAMPFSSAVLASEPIMSLRDFPGSGDSEMKVRKAEGG